MRSRRCVRIQHKDSLGLELLNKTPQMYGAFLAILAMCKSVLFEMDSATRLDWRGYARQQCRKAHIYAAESLVYSYHRQKVHVLS